MRGGTRPSRSNADRRGPSTARPPDTTASASLARLYPQHRVLDVVEPHQRRRVRHGRVACALQVRIVPAVSSSATTVPAEPPLELVGFRGVGVLRAATAGSGNMKRTPHHFARPWSAFVAHELPAAVLRIPAPKPVASETRSGASS